MAGTGVYTKRERHIVLAAACIAIFVNPLTGSMLNLALEPIQLDFGCSEHDLGFLTSIYFIISVMFLLPFAKLSDIFGKKRIFMLGAAIALAGQLLSVFSWNIYSLYVFRGITAIGMAAISCTSVAMISDVYPPGERGGAIGLNTACVYLGASIGPTIGGIISEYFGWKAIFIVLVPFLVSAFILMFIFRYDLKYGDSKHFDSAGSVFYAIGIFVLMFGVVSLPEFYSFILIAVGILIIVGFIIYETKLEEPIFRTSLFRNQGFTRSIIALFLNYAASFAMSFFLSRYLEKIGALTPTQAGIVLMIMPFVQVITTLIAGKMSDKMDKRILPTAGMVILGIALFMLTFLQIEINYGLLVTAMVIGGIGYGMFSAPNTSAVMSYVKSSEYNQASGMISVFRQLGMMFSMGIATCMISVFLGSDTVLTEANFNIFMDVMRYSWVMYFILIMIGAVFSWFRGKNTVEYE